MYARTLTALAAAAFSIAAATSVLAKDPPKQGWAFGKAQFEARCATCHAKNGKGNGPAAQEIGLKVPDLTTYAKRNGGTFPTDLAWQKIDGRPATYDVNRQMPVWGADFRHEAMANVNRTAAPESYVTAEIYAILEHLRTIQVK
jgi:mono/diheme cytochrome c family protein